MLVSADNFTFFSGTGSDGGCAVELRAPLPPFDTPQPPEYLPVYTSKPLNQNFPEEPTKNWPIADWFSVEVPGLPWVDGQSSEHPYMALSYFLCKYTREWQEKILCEHAKRGYSHFMMHWGVANQDVGMSIPAFVDLALLVKQYIPYSHIMLAGKGTGYNDSNWDDPNGIRSYIEPVLEALVEANAVDMVSMFETNLWNIPGPPLQSILQGISDICKPHNVDEWVHFSTGVTFWGEMSRAEWWRMQEGILTGLLYQGDVSWTMGKRQEQILLTTDRPAGMPQFADGTFKFCAAEMDGMLIYDPNFSEDIGNLHGWEHLCTPGLCAVQGVCNGVRRPNGMPLLMAR